MWSNLLAEAAVYLVDDNFASDEVTGTNSQSVALLFTQKDTSLLHGLRLVGLVKDASEHFYLTTVVTILTERHSRALIQEQLSLRGERFVENLIPNLAN
jgi:hypothetical protein